MPWTHNHLLAFFLYMSADLRTPRSTLLMYFRVVSRASFSSFFFCINSVSSWDDPMAGWDSRGVKMQLPQILAAQKRAVGHGHYLWMMSILALSFSIGSTFTSFFSSLLSANHHHPKLQSWLLENSSTHTHTHTRCCNSDYIQSVCAAL